eukprot:TRINITY_DN266_c0_g1_i1.p1 TRINITY_DN266_c0_g1~~TRINITY_DN266_c0_g1_i1.p1  ORF type:complete len:193 (+),score=66.08 TRINITY_DN266_c0_g1_i1:1393-1971(+)
MKKNKEKTIKKDSKTKQNGKVYIDENKFNFLLNEILKTSSIKQINGFIAREVVFGYKKLIIPSLKDTSVETKQKFTDFFECLSQIIFFLYLEKKEQQISLIRQRAWVRTYQLSNKIVDLFGKKGAKSLMDNYLHNIISHFPECFEEGPLSEISTERFESYISKMIKKTHNNREVEALFGIMEKSYEEQFPFK